MKNRKKRSDKPSPGPNISGHVQPPDGVVVPLRGVGEEEVEVDGQVQGRGVVDGGAVRSLALSSISAVAGSTSPPEGFTVESFLLSTPSEALVFSIVSTYGSVVSDCSDLVDVKPSSFCEVAVSVPNCETFVCFSVCLDKGSLEVLISDSSVNSANDVV